MTNFTQVSIWITILMSVSFVSRNNQIFAEFESINEISISIYFNDLETVQHFAKSNVRKHCHSMDWMYLDATNWLFEGNLSIEIFLDASQTIILFSH